MVRGIENFQNFFKEVSASFVLLGGAACQEWFKTTSYTFRSTRNIDIFLIPETSNGDFRIKFWDYILLGNYAIRMQGGKKKIFFRFSNPGNIEYPEKIELLSHPEIDFTPPQELKITSLQFDRNIPNLAEIFLQEDYYRLALECREQSSNGLPLVSPGALLILKIKAYLNLETARNEGKTVWKSEIKKHRNDVFRLVYLLGESFEAQLPKSVRKDLSSFLRIFSEKNAAWRGIQRVIIDSNLPDIAPKLLLSKIQTYYNL